MPSGATQAALWSERAADWAEVMEGWNGWGVPVYRHALEHVPIAVGTALLDVGCGAGRFARMAADRGAHVSGLDATEALLVFARERVRGGDFREGDLEALPWPDASFDIVTGFNSFFIAADLRGALAEARRVLRPGGWLAMSVFGAPDRCDSTALFGAVMALLGGGGSSGGGDEPALHEEGVLERIVREAGFRQAEGHAFGFEERHPDTATLVRGMMAAPPMIRAGRAVGDDAVQDALSAAAAPFLVDGEVVLNEEVRVVVARA